VTWLDVTPLGQILLEKAAMRLSNLQLQSPGDGMNEPRPSSWNVPKGWVWFDTELIELSRLTSR
jgi:hypothetical protein